MKNEPRADHPRLRKFQTKEGANFEPDSDCWHIQEGHTTKIFDFRWLENIATIGFINGLKAALVWYAINKSIDHTRNMFERARHLLNFRASDGNLPLSQIRGVDIINYHSTRPSNELWYLTALSGFIKKWHALGHYGISQDAVSTLSQLKLRGNRKGVAVQTMDPIMGPYTDIELEGIQSALNRAYHSGNVSAADYLLAWLFMLLGQRSVQYAVMKVMDVAPPAGCAGAESYVLRVPRGKQQSGIRTQFKERLITPQIGKHLHQHAEKIRKQFRSLLENPEQAPLFPADRRGGQPKGMEYHQTAQAIQLRLTRVLGKLNVRSERTGNLVHIASTRFRRTIGTRAAQEGHGELVIAELLDHSDTQNVGIYVEATPKIVERIDSAVATALAPLAQAFAGTLIHDEVQASRADDFESKIFAPQIERSCRPMGSCGSFGYCALAAPVACYTCPSFEAWVDGPHEAVLTHLLNERERKIKVADLRIASINDRTILAVAEVVRLCREAQASSANSK